VPKPCRGLCPLLLPVSTCKHLHTCSLAARRARESAGARIDYEDRLQNLLRTLAGKGKHK